jgi:putative ABC transport system permease protein
MEIRPIISALMRSKVALILIGLQIALTLAIVCNALFIISQRIETMGRPSGMNETATFMLTSFGLGANFNTKNAFAEDLDDDPQPAGRGGRQPHGTTPMADSGWSEAINMAPGQKVATTSAAIYFVDEHGINLRAATGLPGATSSPRRSRRAIAARSTGRQASSSPRRWPTSSIRARMRSASRCTSPIRTRPNRRPWSA